MRRNLVIALAFLAVPAALIAAPQGEHRGMFAEWDADADGVVTRAEAEKAALEHVGRRFDAVDVNKDGRITREEIESAREERRDALREKGEERFKAADTNGDGSLSKEEAAAGMPRVARNFERLDGNKDGLLSEEELKAAASGHRRAR